MRKPSKKRRSSAGRQKQKLTGLHVFNIEISFDEDFHPYDFEITDEIADAVNTYVVMCNKNPKKAARELPAVIERYPEVPFLRNHLFVALKRLGRLEEAYAVNDQAIRDHPSYIFSVMNKAIQFWEKDEFEEAERILGGKPLVINRTFPTRKVFHAREVFAYYSFLIRLESSRDNPEAAESYYNLLSDLAPDHPELPKLKELIEINSLKNMFSGLMANIKKSEERRANRKKRTPKPKPKKKGDPDQGDLFEP